MGRRGKLSSIQALGLGSFVDELRKRNLSYEKISKEILKLKGYKISKNSIMRYIRGQNALDPDSRPMDIITVFNDFIRELKFKLDMIDIPANQRNAFKNYLTSFKRKFESELTLQYRNTYTPTSEIDNVRNYIIELSNLLPPDTKQELCIAMYTNAEIDKSIIDLDKAYNSHIAIGDWDSVKDRYLRKCKLLYNIHKRTPSFYTQ